MEKYVRASDVGKDRAKVFTAEEIADNVRGVGRWFYNGSVYLCENCGCGSKDKSRYCKYCGARKVSVTE